MTEAMGPKRLGVGLRDGGSREGPWKGLSSRMSGRQKDIPLAELIALRGKEVSNRNPEAHSLSRWMDEESWRCKCLQEMVFPGLCI